MTAPLTRPTQVFRDPCPLCRSNLGTTGHRTRRQCVRSPERGVFVWQCPDCQGSWIERRH